MSSSVSFRITRTAEDLAQTITALSQRLVKLEQRQDALELQLRQQRQDAQHIPDDELATLDGIDQLLQETRDLLEVTAVQTEPKQELMSEASEDQARDEVSTEPSDAVEGFGGLGDNGCDANGLQDAESGFGDDHCKAEIPAQGWHEMSK